MVTGLQRPDELSEADAYVFNLLMYRHLHVILLAGERALAGEVSQDMGSRLGEHYREVLVETPGGKAWLQAHRAEQWREPLEALGLADALDWSA